MALPLDLNTRDSAILGLSLTASVIYGIKTRSEPHYSRMFAKTASTSLLSALVVSAGGPKLLITALALGSVGDAFLSWNGQTNFLCALGSFLVAHLFYVALFVQNGGSIDIILSEKPRLFGSIVMLFLTLTMVFLLVPRVAKDLRLPIQAYSAAILSMVLAAFKIHNERIVLGAVLFTLSDTILALDRFLLSQESPHRKWMPYAVWTLYYSGQLFIALGSIGYI